MTTTNMNIIESKCKNCPVMDMRQKGFCPIADRLLDGNEIKTESLDKYELMDIILCGEG